MESIRVYPERKGPNIVTEIKITTNTDDLPEHTETVDKMYRQIRTKAPHLTLKRGCDFNIVGPCPIDIPISA